MIWEAYGKGVPLFGALGENPWQIPRIFLGTSASSTRAVLNFWWCKREIKLEANCSIASWWLKDPFEKCFQKLDHLPRERGENSKNVWNQLAGRFPGDLPYLKTRFLLLTSKNGDPGCRENDICLGPLTQLFRTIPNIFLGFILTPYWFK